MAQRIKLKPDTILKDFWRDNRKFADLFNTCMFSGQEIVHPEHLRELDTVAASIYENDQGHAETVERFRDLVKMDDLGNTYIILGLENQSYIDYTMPLRILEYDVHMYRREIADWCKKHETRKFPKGQKLNLVATMVIYYGEKSWDGPMSLRDMVYIPQGMEFLVPEFPMQFVDISKEKRKFREKDVQTLFELVQLQRENRMAVKDYPPVSKEVAYAVSVITKNKEIQDRIAQSEGEEVDMWQFWKDLKNEGRQEGIQEGRQEGIQEGYSRIIRSMRKKGYTEETISTATELPLSYVREICKQMSPSSKLPREPRL